MLLTLNHIDKTYLQGKMDIPVLKDISLSVESGEFAAIMGPSGSGKTTLMNIIGCLDFPTRGEYLLDGEDVLRHNDAVLSDIRLHSIGFVFQNFYLLPRQSALENVALPLSYAGIKKPERLEIAQAALKRVGLADRMDFKLSQLSGGQCQRVAIARAMVNQPKILLADEPTGSLDTASGKQILALFQKLNDEGVTILMITHEQMVADHAQIIYHIRDGRLMDKAGQYDAPTQRRNDSISVPRCTESVANRSFSPAANEIVSSITVQYPSREGPKKRAAHASRYKKLEPRRKAVGSSQTASSKKQASKPVLSPQTTTQTHRSAASSTSGYSNKGSSPTKRSEQNIASPSFNEYPNESDELTPAVSRSSFQGHFKNPIKTEIKFDPSSWGIDQDEEEF